MNTRSIGKIVLICLLIQVCRCAFSPTETAGTGSGWEGKTTTLTGTIVDERNRPVSGAAVALRSKYFLQNIDTATGLFSAIATDSNGRYRFDSVAAGEYAIEAHGGDSHKAYFYTPVTVSNSVNEVISQTLVQAGSLQGTVQFDTAPTAGNRIKIQIFGLPATQEIGSGEQYAFDTLAAGTYDIKFSSIKPGYAPVIKTIAIAAGENATAPAVVLRKYGCQNFTCDSLIVRRILDLNGQESKMVDSVINGYDRERGQKSDRVWQLHLKGIDSLPLEVVQLTALEQLFITFSPITALPEEIEQLYFLYKLFVYKTELSTLPKTIGNMDRLSDLVLKDNELTALPDELMKLERLGLQSGLSRFDVTYNRLDMLSEDMESWMSLHMDDEDERRWKETQKR